MRINGESGSAQLPGAAVVAGEQLAGGRIADDLLRRRIPSDPTASLHRDRTEVAGDRGVVRGFHGRDRGPARFDAVEEIAVVIAGLLQLHRDERGGQRRAPLPLGIRGVTGRDEFCDGGGVLETLVGALDDVKAVVLRVFTASPSTVPANSRPWVALKDAEAI